MKNRLPVDIENRDLPDNEFRGSRVNDSKSYGYVSLMFLTSIIVMVLSVILVMIIR